MRDYILALVERYRDKPLLLDTNLLLVLLVGATSPQRIADHPRTRAYTADDLWRISSFVDQFPGLLATPNIFTEASSLLGRDEAAHEVLRRFVCVAEEHYVESRTACAATCYGWSGITDAGLFVLAQAGHLLLTDDARLARALAAASLPALNSNYLRQVAWGLAR